MQTLLVITNVPDAATGQRIARLLVEQRLAACVNLLPGVQSFYHWEGQLEAAQELTLIIKTVQARYVEVEAAICANHPYELPELIALPVTAGLPAYLQWIAQETKKESNV